MLNTILSALLPMVVTFLLGFVAAWHHDFGPTDAPILNRMVLNYVVPLVLFAGTVSTSRAVLSQDIKSLRVGRTSRRIMEGYVFVRKSVFARP
jgi:malonate transporter